METKTFSASSFARGASSNRSPAALAYLGDAVLEVMVRKHLVSQGFSNPGVLNELAKTFVTAPQQSIGVEALLPHLTEEELNCYKRGRNESGPHPKNASVQEYRRATGLEALFGWLNLSNQTERAEELFSLYLSAFSGQSKGALVPENGLD